MKNYLISSNTKACYYGWLVTGDDGGFDASYPITGKGFSIIEVPDGTDLSSYMWSRYTGSPESLLLSETGWNPSSFLTVTEIPPGGLGNATWDGTQWLSTEGNVPTGGLVLESANVSDSSIPVYSGGDITINCEYTCTSYPTATVTYSWTNGGGLPIVGATSSSLTITDITEVYEGNYTCTVLADNGSDFGSLARTFSVTVYPALP